MVSANEMATKIKELRKLHGLTLEDVAKVVGVGKSTVRKWETGMIANMRRDKIAALAEALHTTPAYLMGWEEPQEETRAETYQRIIKEEAAVQWYNSLNEEQKRLINLLAYLPSDKVDSLLNFAESWMPPQTQEND